VKKSTTVREPIQKRSIEKKEKIIEYGFELICDKGYYNTNTAEIAKAAGVSTGIVYQYFNDKHDILVEGLKLNSSKIFFPMLTALEKNFDVNNLEIVLRKTIKSFIKDHKLSQSAHEEILAMVHSDKEVAHIFYEFELKKTESITNSLIKNGFSTKNLKEKVHIIVNLIDDLCHEIVYHKHSTMNYDVMVDLTIETIMDLLEKD
jgi:AcrR family transcriptional regulator